jgi:hypothetical protein
VFEHLLDVDQIKCRGWEQVVRQALDPGSLQDGKRFRRGVGVPGATADGGG